MTISSEKKRKIIISNSHNYKNLSEKEIINLGGEEFEGKDKNCGDIIFLFVEKNNYIINNFFFCAEKSCILTISLINIISNYINKKSIILAKELLKNFKLMIEGKKYELENFENLKAFEDIKKFPNRIKCIYLVIDSINFFLK